jgi:hypothetical protein
LLLDHLGWSVVVYTVLSRRQSQHS